MNELRKIFSDANIADTRHWSLENALAECHRAFSHLDTYNRNQIIERMPFIAQAARFYGLHMNACNTFENDEILMPEQIEKLIRDSVLDNA